MSDDPVNRFLGHVAAAPERRQSAVDVVAAALLPDVQAINCYGHYPDCGPDCVCAKLARGLAEKAVKAMGA